MFYRRKLILGLLQTFEGEISKIDLFKLLFIVSKEQLKPGYDFIPYLYGCYSFSLNADLDVMCKRNMIIEDNDLVIKKDKKNYFDTLKECDKIVITSVYRRFVNTTTDDLIRYTYTKYPFTATRSEIAEKLLTKKQLQLINKHRAGSKKTILYTIGYEGVSLEEYLNKLLVNNIKLLIDVRRNPVSMKFGFSKNQLLNYCKKLNIEYLHIPEVGIKSDLRQTLKTQEDYNTLFINYQQNNLPETTEYQEKIFELLKVKKRIALTCFEANICQCHRKYLSEAISRLPGWNYDLKHI